MNLITNSSQLGEEDLSICSSYISALLVNHPDTMLQFSPSGIEEFLRQNRAVLIAEKVDPLQLVAFAKIYQWCGKTIEGRTLLEVGSWLVVPEKRGQGYGERILLEAISRSRLIDYNAQIIGVAEYSNHASQYIMTKLGGKVIPKSTWPINFKIMLQHGIAKVIIFDITHVNV